MSMILSGDNGVTFPNLTMQAVAAQTGPAFSVYPSAAVTLTNAVNAIITLNVKRFDTASAFNNTGSTTTLNGLSVPAYSFCPPVAGYYQISGNMLYTTSTGVVQNGVFKNGGQNTVSLCPANSQGVSPCVSILIYLNGTGDYISLYGYQTSGSSMNTQVGRPDLNWMMGSLARVA